MTEPAPAILHIDMDAFFASVEQARRPEFRGLPVIVGGERGGRGVVSACSYEARSFGVHSALPMAQAERLCPQGVFLPVDMAAYKAVHRGVVEIFRRYTDLVEVASIDEAYLDVAGSRRLFGPPRTIALRIQEQIYDTYGITCSIGIAATKPLAKLAAGLKKPAGIDELTEADVHGRLRELPVGKLFGIGPVMEERLLSLGITTIGALQDAPLSSLTAEFGRSASDLQRLVFGQSTFSVRGERPPAKSISREVTFADDTSDRCFLHGTLLSLADFVASELRVKGLAARTVTIKVRLSDFRTFTRRRTLTQVMSEAEVIYELAISLLDDLRLGSHPIRLLGVGVSGLVQDARQLALDDDWRKGALTEAVDRVRRKYGFGVVRPAGAVVIDRSADRSSAADPPAPPEG